MLKSLSLSAEHASDHIEMELLFSYLLPNKMRSQMLHLQVVQVDNLFSIMKGW